MVNPNEQEKTKEQINKENEAKLQKMMNADTQREEKEKQKGFKKAVKAMTIRDKLMARTNKIFVNVNIEAVDESIKCRLFKWKEEKQLNAIFKELQNKDITEQREKELETEMFKLVAYPSGVCLDKTLTMDFWQSGDFNLDVPIMIARQVGLATKERIDEARFFRKSSDRTNNERSMRKLKRDNRKTRRNKRK